MSHVVQICHPKHFQYTFWLALWNLQHVEVDVGKVFFQYPFEALL
jgi:hypothetical protein